MGVIAKGQVGPILALGKEHPGMCPDFSRSLCRRIKGSVVDFALADPNNDGTKDLVVCLNTHPGALGLQNRKTVVVFYPLDLSMMDPKTAPALD